MVRTRFLPALAGLLVLIGLVVVLAPRAGANNTGPDYVSSDNVELLGRIKTPGDGVGARIVGKYMYVTTTKSLSIYDISDTPENPKQVGTDTMDIEFENEEVPTNGRFLGISGQIGCPDPTGSNILNQSGSGSGGVGSESTGCLTTFDVSNPAAPRRITSVAGAGQHTTACIYDCTWLYGSTGAITDNTDSEHPKLVGDWRKAAFKAGYFKATCHHLREIQPGILLGSCQPLILLSVRPEDGGSIMKPVVLATGTNSDDRFVHSGQWPNNGTDKFALIGGETNFQQQCTDEVGAFMVWDASGVADGKGGFNKGSQFKLVSEIRPVNGNYVDGHAAENALGCSVHWFEQHPTFKNGGLVALAEYENGTHFLQITSEGKIIDQGFFLPLGGSTSAPHWNPFNPRIVYSVDYARGVDVLKYNGDFYVPGQPTAGAVPGTNSTAGVAGAAGSSPDVPECASAAGFRSVGATGKGRSVTFASDLRESRPFGVDVFQQSAGRSIVHERLRARFTNRKAGFTWNGRDTRGRRVTDGNYFVRFSMKLANGQRDVRRLTLRRVKGRFRAAPDFYQRTDCGVFKSFKLSSSVFGGRGNSGLGIAYRLARGANAVTLEALVGNKVVQTFRGAGERNKTYRFTLKASKVKRGQTVKIRATVQQGSPVQAQVLSAKRI